MNATDDAVLPPPSLPLAAILCVAIGCYAGLLGVVLLVRQYLRASGKSPCQDLAVPRLCPSGASSCCVGSPAWRCESPQCCKPDFYRCQDAFKCCSDPICNCDDRCRCSFDFQPPDCSSVDCCCCEIRLKSPRSSSH